MQTVQCSEDCEVLEMAYMAMLERTPSVKDGRPNIFESTKGPTEDA